MVRIELQAENYTELKIQLDRLHEEMHANDFCSPVNVAIVENTSPQLVELTGAEKSTLNVSLEPSRDKLLWSSRIAGTKLVVFITFDENGRYWGWVNSLGKGHGTCIATGKTEQSCWDALLENIGLPKE